MIMKINSVPSAASQNLLKKEYGYANAAKTTTANSVEIAAKKDQITLNTRLFSDFILAGAALMVSKKRK